MPCFGFFFFGGGRGDFFSGSGHRPREGRREKLEEDESAIVMAIFALVLAGGEIVKEDTLLFRGIGGVSIELRRKAQSMKRHRHK